MIEQYRAIGLFSNHRETETALRELIKIHGFPSKQVSIVARDRNKGVLKLDSELNSEVESGDRISQGTKAGSLTGGTVGGLTGLLIGLGTIAIPGIGPIMLAGAATTAIATTIAGSAIGAATGTLVGGLVGLGIPKEKAKAYRAKVTDGGYLVIIEGTIDEIQLAEEILTDKGMEDWEVFDAYEEAKQIERSVATEQLIEIEKPLQSHHLRMMGTFPHLPEAKTAVIDLIETGFPIDSVTLFINDDDRHDWFPNLKVCDTLDYSFNRLSQDRRTFFLDSFNRGQYILMMDGTDTEIGDAEMALRTEGIHGFYIFDPYENSDRTVEDLPSFDSRPLVEIIDRRASEARKAKLCQSF